MIPRKSKAKSPAVRAVNDFMRFAGVSPSADEINAYLSAAQGCLVECTPEAFGKFLRRERQGAADVLA